MASTVRGMVGEIQRELLEPVLPSRACELLSQLSSLFASCTEELREAEMAYNHVLLECYQTEETANRAKIRAETSPEYARKRVAHDTNKIILQMISSLKTILKSQQEEMRLSR